jgi:hypothetical protein
MDTLRVVINEVTNLPDPNDPVAVEQAVASSSWASSVIGEDEDENEPMTEEEPAVGVFALTFYWRDIITNCHCRLRKFMRTSLHVSY